MPFAVGPDAALLARIGGGALWIAALTAALLPIERLVEPDRADGVLDQLLSTASPTKSVAAAKIAAHWLTFGAAAAARGGSRRRCLLGLGRRPLPALLLALAVGTPGLAALAVAVAALTAGLPRAGALAGLLLLPLAVPLLIFGARPCRRSAIRRAAARSGGVAAAGRRGAVRRRRRDPGRADLVDLDQRAKIAVGSSSPRASSRTAISPTSTVPPRSPSAWLTSSPIASADIRTA